MPDFTAPTTPSSAPDLAAKPAASAENKLATGVPGILVKGRFWHLSDQVNGSTLALRSAKKITQKAIVVMVIAVSLGSLAVFGINASIDAEQVITAAYWMEPNFAVFAFCLAILGGMFVFYRVVEKRESRKVVPDLGKDQLPEMSVIPSLDVVERRGNIGQVLSDAAWRALQEAYELAHKGHAAQVEPLHLFVGTLSSQPVNLLFMRLGLSFEQMKDALRRRLATFPQGETEFGRAAHEVVTLAFRSALRYERPLVSPIEIFMASYAQDEFVQELLFSLDVERVELENAVMWVRINEKLKERYEESRRAAAFKPTGNMNRAYTAVATPFLDRVSEDLTVASVKGYLPLLVGRDREMNELLRAIEGGNQSVVLVGSPGVGKESIIYGLAERMASERVPEVLQDKRLLKLSIPHIVSSQGGAGAEERLLAAMQEVGRSGNIILVIEDLDQLASTSSGGINLAAVLASELEKGYTFAIATTTPQGYTGAVEKTVLTQHFQKVLVEEPERNEAIQVLESKIGGIENKNKVVFTYEALAATVDLSTRYMHDTYLPEKAVQLAREVALAVAKRGQEWGKVGKEDVATIVSEKTRVPVTQVTQEESTKLLQLEERMHERVIGQDDAVKAVASALRRARAELRAENRPIANFLFLGPTGVGKTELAKTTAEVYFGSEDSMLRFDMSEYQDKASIVRLIGSAGEAGLMTEAVRQNPFSLLLLDELEKAHPDILNLFLQVMDDGRLTDGQGRTVDFTNVILIATSNAGTQFLQDEVAKGTALEQIKTALMERELKQVYRPEFLNRFDGVMIFKPLSRDDVVAIAYLMIAKVASRLEAKGINFQASDEAVHELAQKGYDPKFGARPLRRVIQESVDNAVANYLLQGKVGRRDTLVLEPGGNIRLEKAEAL